MYCRGCGYDLRKLDTTRCPECGRGFDPNDASTYHLSRPVKVWPYIAIWLGLTVFWLGFSYVSNEMNSDELVVERVGGSIGGQFEYYRNLTLLDRLIYTAIYYTAPSMFLCTPFFLLYCAIDYRRRRRTNVKQT
jgi:hypothetical protein